MEERTGFINWLTDEFARKYHNPEEVLDMIRTQKSDTILNPAYNQAYKEWLDTKIDDLAKIHEVKLRPDDEGLELTVDMIGVGGVGSNILYMLQKFKYKALDDKREPMNLSFFEFDDWELSNLPRIPVIPVSKDKATTIRSSKLGFNDEKETDFNNPLFFEGCHNIHVNSVPIGAMDLKTRKNLWDLRAPFITITHKDDELQIKLCPEPTHNLDLVNETYGMIDLNFLLPATHMASEWVRDFLVSNEDSGTVAGETYALIDNYKIEFRKVFNQVFNYTDTAYADFMYEYKHKTPEHLRGEIKTIREWTYINTYGYLATLEGLEYAKKLLDIPEITYDRIPEDIWHEDLANKVLLTIKKDDVNDWLEDFYKKQEKA